MATQTANLYDILEERGFIAQSTDEQIRRRFETTNSPVVAYSGFDPTADSLHIGSLVPMMGLAHLQRCGHKPIVILGGATALVGDPSGKTESRQMLTREQININVDAIAEQFRRVIDFNDSATGAVILNNADWLCEMNWIDLLREYGPHFSVNRMLTMDSVKGRLNSDSGGGISFLEFNYMVMQAVDFLHLHRELGCTVQMGGQDQWGNIVMGIELIRRLGNSDKPQAAAGLTFPLVTKADGGKFGKSEQGNVWLDAKRTSAYEFYQFWRNTADADVGKFLGLFTFIAMDEVRSLTSEGGAALNTAKDRLAFEVTKLIHGETEAEAARDSARNAFGTAQNVTGDAIPHATLAADDLEPSVIELLVRGKLAQSNSEAKKLIQGGGVRIHDQKVSDIRQRVTTADVRDGYVLLRAGKKRLFRFDVD